MPGPEPEAGKPKFLGEFEPHATLLPAEYYRGINGEEIQRITSLGNHILTISRGRDGNIDVYHINGYSPEGDLSRVFVENIGLHLSKLVETHFKEDPSDKQILLSESSDAYEPYSLTAFRKQLTLSEAQKEYVIKKLIGIETKMKGPNDPWKEKKKVIKDLEGEGPIFLENMNFINIPGRQDLVLISYEGKNTALSISNKEVTEQHQLTVSSEQFGVLQKGEAVKAIYDLQKAGISIVQRVDNIVTIRSSNGETLYTFGTSNLALDNSDEPKLFFVSEDEKRVQWVDIERVKAGIWRPEDLEIALPAHTRVQKLDIDPNSNFLAVEYLDPSGHTIAIIDKDTGKIRASFGEASPQFCFDPSGNVIFVDSQNRLRKINTNFAKIPAGGVAALEEVRTKRLEELAAKIEALQLPQVGEVATGNGQQAITEEEVLKKLENKIATLFATSVERVTSLEELATVKTQLQALKENPEYANYPQSFAASERMILLKENGFRVDDLERRAVEIQTGLGEVVSLEQASALSREVASLRAERATGVSIMDPARRALIDARLNTLQSQASEVMKHHLKSLSGELQTTLEGMQTSLQTAMNESEIGQIFTDPNYMRMTTLLGFVQDPLARQEWEQKMIAAVAENKQRVAVAHSLVFKPEQYEQAAAQRVASQILTELAREMTEISSSRGLQEFNLNPLVTQFLEQAKRAGSTVEHQAREALQKLIEERRGGIEAERDLKKLQSGDVVRFNGVEFPIFVPPPPEFEVKTQVSRRGKITPEHRVRRTSEYLRALRAQHKQGEGRRLQRPELGRVEKSFEVEFVDSRGRVYKPGQAVTEAEYDRFLQEQTVKARHHFETFPRNVPKPANDLKMTSWFIENLAKVADECNIQTENQEGILIIEGPAGCGKNFIVDTLAALSNREIFIVPCHSMMDKEDLTYTVEFDPILGTVKKPSSLVEALETEGAIVVFNEWNTAPTGVTKLTNPLTDYMRTLYLALSGERRSIKAKPSVLLIGVINPLRYAGTKVPPQDALSRATVMELGYPPEKDEATMVYGKIESLKKLQTDEFSKLWDYVVVGNAASGGDQFSNTERQQDLSALRQLVKVANTIRQARESFETGANLQQEVHFDFSLRESKQIAIRLEREKRKPGGKRRPVKDIIKAIVLPKIGNLEERERIQTIIENT